ncbi:hypothetical protein J2N86_11165 [Legionella lytica]|uniref:Uncharacterized protein n=1 Tax=Legionella lytica TaxID=96232 RepID=A0ABY4Y6K0_9GAMM|nr:hypothetical protein [Legionella lytica]USQ13242.1 hypothetical protein J2N86_11165 [Legionella lytica]
MAKKTISPGQAVLLLIDHYKKKSSDKDIKILTTLYLNGLCNPTDCSILDRYVDNNKSIFRPYKILAEPSVINNDPTRRYFETHLAYETLMHDTHEVNLNKLIKYVNKLELLIKNNDPARYQKCHSVLGGNSEESDSNVQKEYADYMKRLKAGELFSTLKANQKLVIELFIRASFLAVNCAQSNKINLPLDIYGKGIYAEDARGKELLPTTPHEASNHAGNVRSKHFGLMKGHMPLPGDDNAMAESIIPFLKGSDQSRFVFGKLWTALNFSRQMHPFSNSISGSMLCQLRTLSFFNQKNEGYFSESHQEFQAFFKLYISTLLFYNGGHSLFEFVAPLILLPAIHNEFSKNKIDFTTLTIANIFSSDPIPLNKALDKAIAYNFQHLRKQFLNDEIVLFKWPKRKRDNDLEENKKLKFTSEEPFEEEPEKNEDIKSTLLSPKK